MWCASNFRKIFSFDLDARRLATMGTMTLKAGVLCAQLIHQDFLKADPNDPKFAKVEYVIVDPSCSGSGKSKLVTENHIREKENVCCVF